MPLTRRNKKDRKDKKASRKDRKNRKDRKDKKASRKDRKSRKASRKDRKSRKSYRKNKKQAGGSMAQSLAQGRQFAEYHTNQHGGAYLTGAPVSQIDGSMLEPGLRGFARVEGLDASVAAAATQRDPDQMPAQAGGRRKNRKSGRKSGRKASKKSKKSKKSRRQAGGALTGAPFNGPTMLLTPAQAAKAGTADFSNPLLKY